MKARTRKAVLLVVASLALVAAFALLLIEELSTQRLPYSDRFNEHKASEWHAFGGAWGLTGGMVVNRSDELGAKIVTGSEGWTNYQMTTDLEMLGHGGDIGLLVRVNGAETGINSYRGYYVGVRLNDDALIMGDSDYDWLEARPVAIAGGVHSGTWYRLHVVVVGCRLAAEVTNLESGAVTHGALEESRCPASGKIGLRSLGTGAAWRSVHVGAASDADLDAILKQVKTIGHPEFPAREDKYSQMRASFPNFSMSNQNNIQTYDANASQEVPDQSLPVTSIRLLETGGYTGHVAMLHGVVTRTDPLYIEDDTGGIAVHMSHTASVNLGDEVELLGSVVEAGAFPSFDATTLRLLWAGTPLIASSITSSQAASGRFEGSLVELSGMLIAKHKSPQGDIVLELADIDQHFRIEVPQGLSDKAFNSWQEGSELRVRGICANELSADASEIPFSILVRSDGDVQVISGPPWNHGMRLVYLLMVVGMLGVAGVYLYLRAERWRMRAIMQERERLAIDIHDTLAQSFAGVGFQLQSLRKGLREQGGISTSLLRKIDVACEMAAHTHREATSAIFSLQPGGSADGDLITLLQRACMSMLEGAHLQIKLHRSGESQAISLPVQDALFRIGREAFSNVLRHSKATEVTISIDYGARVLKLSLSDNGVGFNVDQENRGFGLQGMVIRGEKVGAVINVRSAPRCGTTIAVVAPYGRWFSLSDWIRLQFGHMTKRFDVQSSSSRTNP